MPLCRGRCGDVARPILSCWTNEPRIKQSAALQFRPVLRMATAIRQAAFRFGVSYSAVGHWSASTNRARRRSRLHDRSDMSAAARAHPGRIARARRLGRSQSTSRRVIENRTDLMERHSGKPLDKLRHRSAVFEILKQRGDGNTCPAKNPGTTNTFRIALNCRTPRPIDHEEIVPLCRETTTCYFLIAGFT